MNIKEKLQEAGIWLGIFITFTGIAFGVLKKLDNDYKKEEPCYNEWQEKLHRNSKACEKNGNDYETATCQWVYKYYKIAGYKKIKGWNLSTKQATKGGIMNDFLTQHIRILGIPDPKITTSTQEATATTKTK